MKGSGFIASENDLFVLSPTADKAGEAPACDFPTLPLAQALHLGEAGATEGGQAHEQKKKKPQSLMLTAAVNVVFTDPCPSGHKPS